MLGLGEGLGVLRELIIVLDLPSEIAILSSWSRSLTRLVVASVILIGVVSITFALGVITFGLVGWSVIVVSLAFVVGRGPLVALVVVSSATIVPFATRVTLVTF